MTTEVLVPRGRRPVDLFLVLRVLLAVGWTVVACVTLALGERESSIDHLAAAIADGHVHEVTVAGGLRPGSTGFATQQVRWRSGFVPYVAEVVQRSPGDAAGGDLPSGVPVVRQDIGERLAQRSPDVEVTRVPVRYAGSTLGKWWVPDWVAISGFALVALTLVLLARGPEPRWATRWGWFWTMALAPPFGVPAYLVLGRPRDPVPEGPDRRVTGFPALMLALVFLPLVWVVVTMPF
ncbi:hypothetical protein FB382_000397 [Nocardioides ginsengisegetis]|uniref:Uncharacterized protein n=1 Tax=Nocardioides ginsengisegetis TaxID=661491 RepID=A0A7W3P874_9ACTN|nr:hypothetical protein [Nocardioides ginsengisegetis]MBA8802106.1 hypothetical protein [Nocardioides ginsengisegetis]